MTRLPSTRREWVGPSALSYLSGRLPGALPQAGIEPRLRRFLAARSDGPWHGVAGNAPTAQSIPAWGLPSTRREWVGPPALGYLSGRLPGALPQAGIKPRLRRFLAARSDGPWHGVAGNAPTAQSIPAWAPSARKSTPAKAPTAQSIPAWGNAPCMAESEAPGLKAGPIGISIPQIPFIEFHSVFL